MMNRLILLLLLFFWMLPATSALGVILVDFGASATTNNFDLSGWDSVLKSDNLVYTTQGNGGVVAATEIDEFADFRGVRGTTRAFGPGERIVVTWYNNSDQSVRFTARISFTDANAPGENDQAACWYTMRSFTDYRETYVEVAPQTFAKTAFNITDSGVHQTNASYSLVNINLAIEWGSTYEKQFLVCDKIELRSDADITPPAPPAGIRATVLSDSKIQLNWQPAVDNVAVVEYLIYLDGAVEGYSRSNEFTCVFLEPQKNYTFTVTALDATGNESAHSAAASAATPPFQGNRSLLNPARLTYQGAFVLPEELNWGGEAIAYFPTGDGGGSGPADGFFGSLFVTNLNQRENGLVGEVSIPAPVISSTKELEQLNQASLLTQPVNIRPSNVEEREYVDIWRTGLEFLPVENRLYSSWSIHYTVSGEKHASISCCDVANLADSPKYGAWYLGRPHQPPIDAMANDWLFAVPQSWADVNCAGRTLVVGRCRDGGLSGLGPTLYAFSPVGAAPPNPDSELSFTRLLEYGPVSASDNYHFPNSIDGYKHSDDWREALWLTADQQNAVAIVGNKALGHNWYGYAGENMRHEWVIADVPYPEFYETDPDGKGWRAHNRQPMIIFYNPADLAKVATGQTEAHAPQPFAAYRIPKDTFWGQAHEIFSATCDNQNRLLYVTEFVREFEGRLIVHVWWLEPAKTRVEAGKPPPRAFRLLQNYPNPFNAATQIEYELLVARQVELKIYNLQGQEIRTLVSAVEPAGAHVVNWDGRNRRGQVCPSGCYFCCLRIGSTTIWRKMLFLR